METEKEKLKREIAEAKAKLKQLEDKEQNKERIDAVKDLSEYTDADKIEYFDNIYNYANEIFQDEINTGNVVDKEYMYEYVMEILAREHDKFWKYFIKMTR